MTYRQRLLWTRIAKPVCATLLAGAWNRRALAYRITKLSGVKNRAAQKEPPSA